jgi:hypothetical protein
MVDLERVRVLQSVRHDPEERRQEFPMQRSRASGATEASRLWMEGKLTMPFTRQSCRHCTPECLLER